MINVFVDQVFLGCCCCFFHHNILNENRHGSSDRQKANKQKFLLCWYINSRMNNFLGNFHKKNLISLNISFLLLNLIDIEFVFWVMARFNNRKQLPIPAKNAERERSRVRCLRNAFQTLQQCLPSVPPNTKLSKLDILILATNYIQILMQTLNNNNGDYIIDHHHHHHSIDFKQSTSTEEMAITTATMAIENSSNQSKVYRPIKVKN